MQQESLNFDERVRSNIVRELHYYDFHKLKVRWEIKGANTQRSALALLPIKHNHGAQLFQAW